MTHTLPSFPQLGALLKYVVFIVKVVVGITLLFFTHGPSSSSPRPHPSPGCSFRSDLQYIVVDFSTQIKITVAHPLCFFFSSSVHPLPRFDSAATVYRRINPCSLDLHHSLAFPPVSPSFRYLRSFVTMLSSTLLFLWLKPSLLQVCLPLLLGLLIYIYICYIRLSGLIPCSLRAPLEHVAPLPY